jgi:hypothetical protein
MAGAAFKVADWAPLAEASEHKLRIHAGGHIVDNGARVLAHDDIRAALDGGCASLLQSVKAGQEVYAPPPPGFWKPPDRLRWVNALNPEQRLEDFPDQPWPWELRAYLLPAERESPDAPPYVHVLLLRTGAIQWRLLPAPESTQAETSETKPPVAESPSGATPGGNTAPKPAPVVGEIPLEPPQPDQRLTYDQMAEYIGRSRNAVRHYVARHHLPTTIGSDGKTLVTISQKALDQLRSDQSPGGDRGGDQVIITRSPGDHPPVGEAGAATPPVPAQKTEAAAGSKPALARDEAPPHEDEDESDWKKLRDFVAAYIKKTHTPTQLGCWNAARNELAGATRLHVFEEYGNQAQPRTRGRPRKA